MFQVQHNFSSDDLSRLISQALKKWSDGNNKFECVTIKCDADGQASGYTFMRRRANENDSTTITFTHDLIESGIYESTIDDGLFLAPGSLVFKYHQGQGFGGCSTVSACAQAASKEQTEQMLASRSTMYSVL